MAQGLSLLHSLGYGGSTLFSGGEGTVIFANSNVIRRVAAESPAENSQSFVCDGFGARQIAVHPQHRCYAVCERGMGALVHICDIKDGREIATLRDVGQIDIDCLAFSSDGATLVTAAGLPDFTVTVWDWEQQQKLVSGTAPPNAAFSKCHVCPLNADSMCFHGDGALFVCNWVTGSSGPELEFMRVSQPTPDATFTSCTWDSAGRLFCSTSDGCLWNVDSQGCNVVGDPLLLSAEPATYHVLAEDKHVICWSAEGVLTWVGAETMAEGHRVKVPLGQDVRLVSVCAEREHVFIGASDGSVFHLELMQAMPDGAFKEEEEEPSVVTVRDAESLVGEVQFDSHHRLRRIIAGHAGRVTAVAPLKGLDCVCSAGVDGAVIVWDPAPGIPLAVQRVGRALSALSAHPLESMVAIGDAEGYLQILDVSALSRIKCRLTVRLFKSAVGGTAFNEDGSLLAVTSPDSNHLYFLSVQGAAAEVLGYVAMPCRRGLLGSIAWGGSRHVIVGDAEGGALLCLQSVPGQDGEGLRLEAPVVAMRLEAAPRAFGAVGSQLMVATSKDRVVRAYDLFQGWARVETAEEVEQLGLGEVQGEREDHQSRVCAVGGLGDGSVLGTASADGMVVVRSGVELGSAGRARVFSAWEGGQPCLAVLERAREGRQPLVVAGGETGVLAVLSGDAGAWGGAGASGATSVATLLLDHLNEPVELALELTFEEGQLLEDTEVQNALNAAKKNATREEIRKLKGRLDEVLERNSAAPEMEKVPRQEIVVDLRMQSAIIAEGEARVANTKRGIARDNLGKELLSQRIKLLAWDSMDIHGAQLLPFAATGSLQPVFNFPIKKPSPEEEALLHRIRAHRSVELKMISQLRKELGVSNSLLSIEAPPDDPEAASPDRTHAGGDYGEEEAEEAWRSRQSDACAYHRFEVSTRERKTAQIVMLQAQISKCKRAFNVQFEEFLQRKRGVLGRIEEKSQRVNEILRELKVPEEDHVVAVAAVEQPETVLQVKEEEVTVAKWVSPAEIAERQAEEERRRQQGEGDDTVERALKQMMGGSLAGESTGGKLDQEMPKPSHLEVREGEELTEEQQRELKEWEAQYKAFQAEKEQYAKGLEAEAKKLKAEIQEEGKKFDESLQELSEARMRTDYDVFELELYKIKLIQAVAQEEDDIESKAQLKARMEDLRGRQELTARAVAEYQEEVSEAERQLEAAKGEVLALERNFKRELVDQSADKEQAETLFRAFRRRAALSDLPVGLTEEEFARADEFRTEALRHDETVHEKQQQAEAMQAELGRLEWANTELAQSISGAEEQLAALVARMLTAGSDLDVTLRLKQGQVEVEQAAVVTDYTDAEIVHRNEIRMLNAAIKSRGKDKVSVLQEIKDFRKGIHQLQWENSRLEQEEEKLLQKTKDLQLLRVTKDLQSVIKGADEGKAAQEVASLEKLISYQTGVHSTRVQERAKSVDLLTVHKKSVMKENVELDEDIFALESAVVERQRLCELQGAGTQKRGQSAKGTSNMKMMVTHRKLLDLAKAQTREIELMREELVRLRARTFPSFAQLSEHTHSAQDSGFG